MAICCFAIYANYPAFTATTAGDAGSSNTKAKRGQRKSRYNSNSRTSSSNNNLARLARHGEVQVAHIAAVALCTQYTLTHSCPPPAPSLSLSLPLAEQTHHNWSLQQVSHIITNTLQVQSTRRCQGSHPSCMPSRVGGAFCSAWSRRVTTWSTGGRKKERDEGGQSAIVGDWNRETAFLLWLRLY